MDYPTFVLVVNVTTVVILLMLALLMLSASRFKGEMGYVGAILALTTVPVYLYNMSRTLHWYGMALCLAPCAYSFNLLVMPLLWLFVQRSFTGKRDLSLLQMAHFAPAVLSFLFLSLYLFLQPAATGYVMMDCENRGSGNWVENVNATLLFIQIILYFVLIFIFLRRMKRLIRQNFSDADWTLKRWIPRFFSLLFVLSVCMAVTYLIYPPCDTWLVQMLNLVAMVDLTYHNLLAAKQAQPVMPVIVAIPTSKNSLSSADNAQLDEYAQRFFDYLQKSHAYLNPDLTLDDVARAIGITYNNLSRAINCRMGKNFFAIVNALRVEYSKQLLLHYKENRLTIDSIAQQSGFNSRFTLNNAFKRAEGVSPSRWLASQKIK